MNPISSKTIITPRLVLRKLELRDAHSIFDYARLEEVARYVTFYPHKDINDAINITERWVSEYNNPYTVRYAITIKDTREMIGVCDLLGVENGEYAIEVGLVINPRFKGNGYGSEAIKALQYYAFKHYGLPILHYCFLEDNEASHRIAIKNKFVYQETTTMLVKGENRTRHILLMKKDDFNQLEAANYYNDIKVILE